jgi:uncharacterized protein (TIGR03435 family)
MFRSSGAATGGVKIFFAAFILTAPVAAYSQAASNKLTFEVATIKPAPELNPMAMAMALQQGKMPHIGMNIQGTRVDIGSMTLTDLVVAAFKVKPYQVTAPDWMKGTRFDILAKMPDGATKDDVPQMLQALLTERFGMKTHTETREDNVYALVVAKGGPKLKESPPDPEIPAEPAPGAITLPNGGGQVKVDPRGGGATFTSGERGTTKMAMTPEGRMHLEVSKVTMEQFAQTLNPLVDHPVFDMTELKGNFQVALDLSMETMLSVARAQGINVPALGGAPGGAAVASDPSGASSIFQSVEQLGLRLEPRKMPLEHVIVDQMEKTPTEN